MVLCSASKWGESVEKGSWMQDFPVRVLSLREGQARMTLLVLCSHNVQPEVYIRILPCCDYLASLLCEAGCRLT